jgi:hypothetical protein
MPTRALLDWKSLSAQCLLSVLQTTVARIRSGLIGSEAETVFKKSALFGLLFLLGAGLGSYAGWKVSSSRERVREWHALDNREGHEFFKTYDLIARLQLADSGSAMRLEDPKEGPERRREYLDLILDAARKGRAQVKDPAVLTLIDVESGITYVRLAMVEEAAGNLPASQTWMQKAQTTLKQAGWKDYSEAHLKDLVQALNKRDSCNNPCSGS